eukprot:5520019-Pyramimonas_sp.AAC.1
MARRPQEAKCRAALRDLQRRSEPSRRGPRGAPSRIPPRTCDHAARVVPLGPREGPRTPRLPSNA